MWISSAFFPNTQTITLFHCDICLLYQQWLFDAFLNQFTVSNFVFFLFFVQIGFKPNSLVW